MKHYFITGISGFLGQNLVNEILESEKDAFIYGLVLPQENNLEVLKSFPQIKLIEGNILDNNDIDNFLSLSSNIKEEKIIIHLAGRISLYRHGDDLTTQINYQGTKNMVDISSKYHFDKFIYISSVDALNKREGNDLIYEQDRYEIDKVDGVYSKSKVLASNYVLDATKEGKINGMIVLPTVFIGPNDPFNSPINDAIKRFLKGKLPGVVKGKYNIAGVKDIAKGIYLVSSKGRINESYILAGEQIEVIDLINKVAKITNKKPVKTIFPTTLVKLGAPFIELKAKIAHQKPLFTSFAIGCLNQNSNYSNQKANEELGYLPHSLDEILVELVNWMLNSDYLDR